MHSAISFSNSPSHGAEEGTVSFNSLSLGRGPGKNLVDILSQGSGARDSEAGPPHVGSSSASSTYLGEYVDVEEEEEQRGRAGGGGIGEGGAWRRLRQRQRQAQYHHHHRRHHFHRSRHHRHGQKYILSVGGSSNAEEDRSQSSGSRYGDYDEGGEEDDGSIGDGDLTGTIVEQLRLAGSMEADLGDPDLIVTSGTHIHGSYGLYSGVHWEGGGGGEGVSGGGQEGEGGGRYRFLWDGSPIPILCARRKKRVPIV